MKIGIFKKVEEYNQLVEKELERSENGEIISLTDLMSARDILIKNNSIIRNNLKY